MNAAKEGPPVRFVEAERINPFQLLLDLHEHALGHAATPSRGEAVTELALAAAVVSWWSRWQPMIIHAALLAGAELADVADATGLDPAEVVRRWGRWTNVQTQLIIGGRPAVDVEDVRAIWRRLRSGVVR